MQKVLITVFLNWLYGKAAELFLYLKRLYERKKEYEKIEEGNDKQARTVQELADQIRELIKAGQPVPEELKEQLREASRRLADGSDIPNGN
jgi:Txe/YoeB family toxin of Txe-Axe toxin-antitoxin module